MTINKKITLIAAINNQTVLDSNLLRSPLLQKTGVQFVPVEGYTTASRAYNHGLTMAIGDLLVFAHQDVYIPVNWHHQVLKAVAIVEKMPCPWAVLGVVGVNGQSIVSGRCWSTGLAKEVGVTIDAPEATVSVDELIFIVNKNSGLLFDENLPSWHMYGTDIVQEALARGFGAYIIHAPVIHNSLPILRFDAGFVECCRYMRIKWAHRLPIQTCCIQLTRFGLPLLKKRIKQLLITTDRNSFERLPNPVTKARELRYE